MVVVIPLEATNQLIQLSKTYDLSLPVPLSSGCESYLSPEEIDTIFALLTPLQDADPSAATMMADLQAYIDQRKPVIPCDS